MTQLTSSLVAGALIFCAFDLAAAQPAADIGLTAGFAPDPQIVNVTAGGDVNGAAMDGKACAGFRSDEATLRVAVADGLTVLYIYSSAERPTTLAIRDPGGNLRCDQGWAGDPLVVFDAPAAGEYLVWVGGIALAERFEAALILSATPIDPSLEPRFGESTMAAGDTRGGLENALVAGGPLPAAATGAACGGYVTAEPTYSYTYTPGAFSLAVQVGSDADVMLLLRGPDGVWLCDDDSAGESNPLVVIDAPAAGRYDFWLGTKRPALPAERPGDDILSGLVNWFVGDGAGSEAVLYFFEFTPGCTLEPAIPGAQRC